MKKIVMCGYYGMCDSQGRSVGHTSKVTKEYFELLSQKMEILLKASPSIVETLDEEVKIKSEKLKYDIIIDTPFTLKKRILDKFKILYNIYTCIEKTGEQILFFYQIDFFFFFYIWAFFHRKDKKIYCLLYHQNFTSGKAEGILQWIYGKALKKIQGVVYTQKGLQIPHDNILWTPDYFYDEKIYDKYRKMEKQNKMVCLGTMNRYKKLEELVEVFKEIPYKLEICGRFDDDERYWKLVAMKSKNVTITNTVLSEKEYYTKLGQAKYSILPYDMEQYTNRTSGVLLESLYVGSIPIAPKQLLEQIDLPGYGYEQLNDLWDLEWKKSEYLKIQWMAILKNNNIVDMRQKLGDFIGR